MEHHLYYTPINTMPLYNFSSVQLIQFRRAFSQSHCALHPPILLIENLALNLWMNAMTAFRRLGPSPAGPQIEPEEVQAHPKSHGKRFRMMYEWWRLTSYMNACIHI